MKGFYGAREQREDRRAHESDPDPASFSSSEAAGFLAQLPLGHQQLFCARVEELAQRRERHRPRGAVEERPAQFLFEKMDLRTDCGGGHEQLARRQRRAAGIHHGAEVLQLPVVHELNSAVRANAVGALNAARDGAAGFLNCCLMAGSSLPEAKAHGDK